MTVDFITQDKDYWIHSSALSITLNALGNPNRIQCSVVNGAIVRCFYENVDQADSLGYTASHGYHQWPITASPTYFNTNSAKYVYIAIPRSSSVGTQAIVVFPSEKINIYGKNAQDVQVGSVDYFYVWLQAIISDTDGTTNRTWTAVIKTGELGTAEGDNKRQDETDWYQYSKVTGIVTFLKQIVMGDDSKFQNLKALMAVIEQKLTLGSGTTRGELTGVATDDNYESVSEDSDTHIVTPSYLDEFGNTRYLSKVDDDVAQGVITFLKGIKIGQAAQFGIDKDGNATLYDIIFNHILKSPDAAKGIDTGQGIIMDATEGTIEADGLTVRGWMMVRKLIYNYLEIMEQDYQFSGGGDIERVVDNGDGTYTLYIHKEKEGKECSFAPGDILYGKVNENDGNGGSYMYTSWMKAGQCTTGEGRDERGNLNPDTVVVTLWADNMVPGGRNFPPKEFMTVAHRGNVADGYNPDRPDADEHEREQYAMSQKLRQAFWELSTTDHNITHYWNVDQPILRADNYAATFGIMPTKLQQEVLPETSDFTKPGLYASEIYYEHLTPIKYPAKIVKEDRGDWTQSPTATYNADLSGTWMPDFTTKTVGQKTYGLYAQHLAAACGITTQGGSITVAAGDTISDPYHFKTFTLQEWLTERLSASNASLTDAQLEQKILVEWKKDLEISRVWNRGAIWECLVDGTTQEPWFGCTDWVMINGATFSLGFFSDGENPMPIIGLSVRPNNIDETVKPYLLFGQEDISNIVTSWLWERESSNPALDEAWKNSAHVDPEDPTSPLKSRTRTIHITDDDLPSGWDAGDGKVGFKCTATFLTDEETQIMNVITIV